MKTPYATARDVFDKEIAALESVKAAIEPSFDAAVELLVRSGGKLIVTGLGKSGIIGHKIAATFSSTGTPAVFMNAAEALHGDLGVVSPEDVVILISNSGATIELVKLLPSVRKQGTPVIGIFGKADAPLASKCDCVLPAIVKEEACPLNLAPMSSTTAALVVGDALAAAVMMQKGFTPDDFAWRHPGGHLGRNLLLRAGDVMHAGEDLPRVSPEADFRALLVEMTRVNLGAVCVCDAAGKLIGIVTDGDIRRFVLEGKAMDAPAHALMTPNPVTVTPEMALGQVLEVMENRGRQIYMVPVVDVDGQALGMVRMHEIVGQS
ncbi:MAG: SIS domain-containing protein [Opitutales bacterium]